MNKITKIMYPNTVADMDKRIYRIDDGYRFEVIEKCGEMANINWIQVFAGDGLIAEIKESVCDIYYA